MRGIELIEHELVVIDIIRREIEYLSYIENLSKMFNSNKIFKLVQKGTRFKDYSEGFLSKDVVDVYGEYSLLNCLDDLSRRLARDMYYEYGDRYAVIRFSTDNCYPNYRVEFITRSKVPTVNREPKLSYADAEEVRNYHHDLVKIVRLRKGYKKPTKKWIDSEVNRQAGWKYSPRANQVLASHILHNGIEV